MGYCYGRFVHCEVGNDERKKFKDNIYISGQKRHDQSTGGHFFEPGKDGCKELFCFSGFIANLYQYG